jgi:hypothetical protein
LIYIILRNLFLFKVKFNIIKINKIFKEKMSIHNPILQSGIYILIENKYRRDKIYKVGKTDAGLINRIKQYDKLTKVLFFCPTYTSKHIEQVMIKQLKLTTLIKWRKDIGLEYFQGDLNLIKDIVIKITSICAINHNEDIDNLLVEINKHNKIVDYNINYTNYDNDDVDINDTDDDNDNNDDDNDNDDDDNDNDDNDNDNNYDDNDDNDDDNENDNDTNHNTSSGIKIEINISNNDKKFICKRCGYEFSTKQNLITHLRKINKCEPIISNIDIQTLIDEIIPKSNLNRVYTCKHCKKQYKHKVSKYQHQSKCKIRLNDNKSLVNNINNTNAITNYNKDEQIKNLEDELKYNKLYTEKELAKKNVELANKQLELANKQLELANKDGEIIRILSEEKIKKLIFEQELLKKQIEEYKLLLNKNN